MTPKKFSYFSTLVHLDILNDIIILQSLNVHLSIQYFGLYSLIVCHTKCHLFLVCSCLCAWLWCCHNLYNSLWPQSVWPEVQGSCDSSLSVSIVTSSCWKFTWASVKTSTESPRNKLWRIYNKTQQHWHRRRTDLELCQCQSIRNLIWNLFF